MPSRAVEELERNDELTLGVMDLRAYARTKDAVDQAKKSDDVPRSAMVDWVFAVQSELLRRKRAD